MFKINWFKLAMISAILINTIKSMMLILQWLSSSQFIYFLRFWSLVTSCFNPTHITCNIHKGMNQGRFTKGSMLIVYKADVNMMENAEFLFVNEAFSFPVLIGWRVKCMEVSKDVVLAVLYQVEPSHWSTQCSTAKVPSLQWLYG